MGLHRHAFRELNKEADEVAGLGLGRLDAAEGAGDAGTGCSDPAAESRATSVISNFFPHLKFEDIERAWYLCEN